MIEALCIALGAAGFWFGFGWGDHWLLAWLAPAPLLWLAMGPRPARRVITAGFVAAAVGGGFLLFTDGLLLPIPVLVLAILGPASLFTLALAGARVAFQRLGPVAAAVVFAALRTGLDYLAALNASGGAIASPAISQAGVPELIQIASVTGYLGVTFLLSLVPASLASTLRSRSLRPIALAAGLLALDALFGFVRVATPPESTWRVAAIASDTAVGATRQDDPAAALQAVDAYVEKIATLRADHLRLIVLPENIARLPATLIDEVQRRFATAATDAGATVVAGFNIEEQGQRYNVSWAFHSEPNLQGGTPKPVLYRKRHLVPVLESAIYTPGTAPVLLGEGIGLEICKDMDFPDTQRRDAVEGKPALLAVPAWDFGADGWSHARSALLRTVENGTPMVRSARNGLLSISDGYGRILAVAPSGPNMTVVRAELPLRGRGGETAYGTIGDALGPICLAIAAGVLIIALTRT